MPYWAQRIATGMLRTWIKDPAPGTKLNIDRLKKLLEVDASPIQEALSLLTSDHLVDRIVRRGFRVAHVSETGFA